MDPLHIASNWDEAALRVLANVTDELKRVMEPSLPASARPGPDSFALHIPEEELNACLACYRRACDEGFGRARIDDLDGVLEVLDVLGYATAASILRLVASGYTLLPVA